MGRKLHEWKEKKMESTQLIMATERARSACLKAKINPESQNLHPNQKKSQNCWVMNRLYTLFFRGRGNSEQSFYQKGDPCFYSYWFLERCETATYFLDDTWKLYNANIYNFSEGKNSLSKACKLYARTKS